MNPFLLFTLCLELLLFFAVPEANSQSNLLPQVQFIKISDHVYIHNSSDSIDGFGWVWSNGLILTDNQQAFIFDTPVSEENCRTVIRYIRDSLHSEPVGFLPNHWHSDCMGGIEVLNRENIPSFANRLTIEIARSKKLPVPDSSFTDSLTHYVGNIPFKAAFFGAAHSFDNIVVWIPSEKILFAGCMVKSMQSGNLGFTADGDLKAWPETLKRVLQNFPDARFVIPGHGNYGDTSLIYHTLKLLENK